jgi:hypothetical protein
MQNKSNQEGISLIEILITASIVLILALTLTGGVSGFFVDDTKVNRLLAAQGFSDISITEKKMFFVQFRGCSEGDSAMYTVNATNPAGKKVEGITVCSGVWKGATIRSN